MLTKKVESYIERLFKIKKPIPEPMFMELARIVDDLQRLALDTLEFVERQEKIKSE